MNNYFYRPEHSSDQLPLVNANNRLMMKNIFSVSNLDELLEFLYEKNSIQNNMMRDKNSIKKFLEGKKTGKYVNFMYEEAVASNDVNPLQIQYSVDPTKSADAFIISDAGIAVPSTFLNYRLTLRNSPNLKNEDVLAFMKTFQREAINRNLYIRCKVLFEMSDGIIFYVDKNNLFGVVKLLEDLKNREVYGNKVANAIKNFGHTQPFSATLDDDSYYSIAPHGFEPPVNSKIKSTLGGGLIHTFNSYFDEAMQKIYKKLMVKYNNDINKITVDEFYRELILYHAKEMNVGEAIPLWVNNRIYKDLNSKENLFNRRLL